MSSFTSNLPTVPGLVEKGTRYLFLRLAPYHHWRNQRGLPDLSEAWGLLRNRFAIYECNKTVTRGVGHPTPVFANGTRC